MSTAHLSLDALADLLAGAGSDDDIAHVGTCARCSTDLADLDAAHAPVSEALAALDVPPAPADLDARLRAALAVEPAPLRATADASSSIAGSTVDDAKAGPSTSTAGDPVGSEAGPEPGAAARSRDVVPLASRRRRLGPAVLSAAAASAALLTVVGLGLGTAGSDSGSDSSAASEAGGSAGGGAADGAAALSDVRVSGTGTDYRRDGRALALALPALLGSAADDSARAAEPGTALAAPPAASGPVPAAGAAEQLAVDPLARLRDPAELAGCLSALIGPDVEGVPLALDYASYEGQPALVVVLPSAQAGRVDVFTVGAGCRAGEDRTLLFTRLPRPV